MTPLKVNLALSPLHFRMEGAFLQIGRRHTRRRLQKAR